MITATRRGLARLAVPLLAFAALSPLLSACAAEDDFCSTLLEDTATSATVFTPVVPWGAGVETIDRRIELLEGVEQPPAELAEDLEIWLGYLRQAREQARAGSDPSTLLLDADERVTQAGERLGHAYTDRCL